MIEVSESERRNVISRCVDFLGNIWSEVKDDQIECQRITSGIANKTFHIWIKVFNGLESNNTEIKDVIVRIYYSGVLRKENRIKFIGEAGEAIVHQRLYELGLASNLLGVFDGGIVEEYIPSRPVTVDELKSIKLCKEVIRKLAKFHTLSMPISRNPNLLERVSYLLKRIVIPSNYTYKYRNEIEKCKIIMNFPFEKEFAWIQQILPKVGHKVVFSHNDIHPNNILLKVNAFSLEEKLLLVDYESCTYFYRAYDLACFLRYTTGRTQTQCNEVEISFDRKDNLVTNELLLEYLYEYKKLSKSEFEPEYNLQRLRMEVEFFDLVRDVFCIGMKKCVIIDTIIPFPLTVCANAASMYKQKKQSFITKYGDPVQWE